MIYPDFYPFYATQGSPGFYNEEREQEKEFDLMRSYYPDTARRIQEKAEAQCQLLDYEGSRLYDEYPDRFMLYHICHQVKGQMEGDTSVQCWCIRRFPDEDAGGEGAENVSALSIKMAVYP